MKDINVLRLKMMGVDIIQKTWKNVYNMAF